MANLGNAWHIPKNAEPRGRGAMRDPVGEIVPGTDITIFSGSQFQGGGNPGNQLQTGSNLFFKSAAEIDWTELPLTFYSRADNNKYFSATIAADTSRQFAVGETLEYYLRIAYDDHDTTFLHIANDQSAATADESAAKATPFTFTLADPARQGRWDTVFTFPNVAIHTHVLPNMRVLMWGRRESGNPDLDVQSCTPFVWNPDVQPTQPDPQNPAARPSAVTVETEPPLGRDGQPVNLFCSGHTFLPDGRLLVVGGHRKDSDGLNQASTYTSAPAGSDEPGTWTPLPPMGPGNDRRRWYPTATALPDGSALVLSGSYWQTPDGKTVAQIRLLQVWRQEQWRTIPAEGGGAVAFEGLPLYPRMHVISDGRVAMSGTNATTWLVKTTAPGGRVRIDQRAAAIRDYCPAVMFDKDKIIYIGGGNKKVPDKASKDEPRPPTNRVEVIDLSVRRPQWRDTAPMQFPRRQHNAVILPDGTVLVVGGTRGGGGARGANGVVGFNDLDAGQPVHEAELWDPNGDNGNGAWQQLAAEEVDRCYHSTAVLLPDGRVLSAGGGEYRPNDVNPNDDEDTHRDGQIFSPPYLFKGDRPVVTSAPAAVQYGQTFTVETPDAVSITKVSWIRLPSVTHAFDQNQRINFLNCAPVAGVVSVRAPQTPELCPPGHYMQFLLNRDGVPSKATVIQIHDGSAAPAADATSAESSAVDSAADDGYESYEAPSPTESTAVLIGITGTCPYGIGACWGGAYEALGRLDAVGFVNPVPNAGDSTAQVYLTDTRLPDLPSWSEEFRQTANGTYQLRGFEVTVAGVLDDHGGQLYLRATEQRPEVALVTLSIDKVQWDTGSAAPQRPTQREVGAYEDLAAAGVAGGVHVKVIGPLTQSESGYRLHVREASVLPHDRHGTTR